jgi:hypothetical protein
VVTTHTLFCLKSDLALDAQRVLCGVLNSFVANYLVRLRVTTHVTVAIVDRLPAPRPERGARPFGEIARWPPRWPGSPTTWSRPRGSRPPSRGYTS